MAMPLLYTTILYYYLRTKYSVLLHGCFRAGATEVTGEVRDASAKASDDVLFVLH